MARLRDRQWEELSTKGEIPAFLVTWRRYVRDLKTFETPSYAWLFRLIQRSCDKPAARCAAKRLREGAAGDKHNPDSAKLLKFTREE